MMEDNYDTDNNLDRNVNLSSCLRQPGSPTRRMSVSVAADTEDAQFQSQSQQQGKEKKKKFRRRRRRRSSARFLRLTTGRSLLEEDDDDNDDDDDDTVVESNMKLGEMYQKAIRMNAENRINANNSWSLNLIENIDKFLEEEEPCENDKENIVNNTQNNSQNNNNSTNDSKKRSKEATSGKRRVNFTKASCTLDASVKIYSYRVDDVHLTSYKVLANLNRTDANNKNKNKKDLTEESTATSETEDYDKHNDDTKRRGRTVTKNTNTVETNVANINLSKMDSAFDIDPLFHKMSKTFDEGGAKGLLLVNLGVGNTGCNIVFDSKKEKTEESVESNDNDEAEQILDISTLTTKLDSVLDGQSVESLALVPQLASLRDQYAELDKEGFVEEVVPVSRTQRYASTQEEEKVADISIHQEALERSRISQTALGVSLITDQDADSQPSYGADYYGGGDDNDNNDNDIMFESFIQGSGDYSGISLSSSFALDHEKNQSQSMMMLDAICSGNVLFDGKGSYEYFDSQALQNMASGNLWAGSLHWKRDPIRRQRKEKQTKKNTEGKTPTKKKKQRQYVDLSLKPDLQDILREPPKKNRRGNNPLQMSKTTIAKHSNTDHLLPPDAGIGVEELTSLFLRPGAIIREPTDDASKRKKTVGFVDVIEGNIIADNWDADSFGGGNDDGGAFPFPDQENEEDFEIQELEGVRKVEKVKVGYASIAKKVDVKRLKRDLWVEVESTFASKNDDNSNNCEEAEKQVDEDDKHDSEVEDDEASKQLSFYDTVKQMEASKSQQDVTLPFYFICILHLANEKGLRLDSKGLEDFTICQDVTI